MGHLRPDRAVQPPHLRRDVQVGSLAHVGRQEVDRQRGRASKVGLLASESASSSGS